MSKALKQWREAKLRARVRMLHDFPDGWWNRTHCDHPIEKFTFEILHGFKYHLCECGAYAAA